MNRHAGCIRWSLFAGLLVLGWLGWSDASGADAPPELASDTGLDLLAWAAQQFGYPGIAAWIAWQARAAFQRVGTAAVPVEVRLHADSEALLRRVLRATDRDDPDRKEP